MIQTVRRLFAPLALCAILAACGDDGPKAQKQGAPPSQSGDAPTPDRPTPPLASAEPTPANAFTCDAAHVPHDASAFDALAAKLGAAAVVDHGGDEGTQDYTLYANDPQRTLRVTIGPTASTSRGAFDLTASSAESKWTLPGGLTMGASLEAVEKAQGGPFKLWLTSDSGLADGLGGALKATPNCRYWLRLKPASPQPGAPRYALSSDPDVRAMGLRINEFGLSHVTD